MTHRLFARAADMARAALVVSAMAGGASAGEEPTIANRVFGPDGALSGPVRSEATEFLGVTNINGDGTPDVFWAAGSRVEIHFGFEILEANIGSPVREAIRASRNQETGVAVVVVRADDGLHVLTLTPNGQSMTIIPEMLATGSFGADFETSLISRDVNGDGTPDIVAIDRQNSAIVVYPVAENGVLLTPITSPTTAPAGFLRKVVLADLDGDGDDDAAAFSSPGGLYPLENNGAGTFESFEQSPPGQGYGGSASSGGAADFTGDGKIDIFKLQIGGHGQLLVGDGAGAFTTPFPMIPFPSGAAGVVAADVDGDGAADILSANYGADTISFLKGDGDGGFEAPFNIPTGDGPIISIVGDWDDDGDVDVIVSHDGVHFPQGPMLIENTGGLGDRLLEAFLAYPIADARAMSVGDFDGDGRTDVLVGSTSNAVRLMRGQDGADPLSSPVVVSASLAVTLAGALEPADGDPRSLATFMLASPARTGIIRFDPNTSLATFRQVLTPTASPTSVATGDVTGDGREDLLVSHAGGSPAVTIYPQNAGALFDAPILINGSGGKALVVHEVDGASGLDLLLGDDGLFGFGFGDVQGVFVWAETLVPEAPTLTDIAAGDFDGLPGVDAAIVGLGPDALGRLVIVPQVLAPEPAVVIPLPGAPTDVVAGDVDGDGDTDLAVTLDRGGLADALAILLSVDGLISGDNMTLHQTGDLPARVVLADVHEPNGVVQRGAVTRPAPEAIVLNTGNGILGLRGVTVNLNMAEVREAANCPGDVDGDGFIGFADLNAVVSAFNSFTGDPDYNDAADFDGDGDVDFADLNEVLSAFNTAC